MFFDKLFEFLALYLALLLCVALVGMKFAKKHRELNAEFDKKPNSNANSKLGADAEFNENLELGVEFSKNSAFGENADFISAVPRKKSALSGLYKHCPCRKAVENGTMSSICVYSGVAGFMLSLTNIALISDYRAMNFIVLALSSISAWFGWILKK